MDSLAGSGGLSSGSLKGSSKELKTRKVLGLSGEQHALALQQAPCDRHQLKKKHVYI